MANNHVDFLAVEDKKKWLKQRGWILEGQLWRDPETGYSRGLEVAITTARKACRVPADFELRPV